MASQTSIGTSQRCFLLHGFHRLIFEPSIAFQIRDRKLKANDSSFFLPGFALYHTLGNIQNLVHNLLQSIGYGWDVDADFAGESDRAYQLKERLEDAMRAMRSWPEASEPLIALGLEMIRESTSPQLHKPATLNAVDRRKLDAMFGRNLFHADEHAATPDATQTVPQEPSEASPNSQPMNIIRAVDRSDEYAVERRFNLDNCETWEAQRSEGRNFFGDAEYIIHEILLRASGAEWWLLKRQFHSGATLWLDGECRKVTPEEACDWFADNSEKPPADLAPIMRSRIIGGFGMCTSEAPENPIQEVCRGLALFRTLDAGGGTLGVRAFRLNHRGRRGS